MKNYMYISDLENLDSIIKEAINLKENLHQYFDLGKHKTIVLLFFNSSLRTRLST
ncbi:MAG: acetylornithine carbamoyltransferase, partial [Flavobacteriaceae bacterium]|nr:acetylornithine carbamoyltransferase [Flavobacteriaceae bacterium]